jgi:histidinol-phosphate phosphatase family protein
MKAIFLDRDGVINKDPGVGDYIKSWDEFQFLPNVIEAIKLLTENKYEIFIISNQAGVAKGLYTKDDLEDINKKMLKEIGLKGGRINKIMYCPHLPDAGCSCRKPNIGMIKEATEGLNVDFKNSYFIGDSKLDIEAGKKAGCKTVLLLTGKEKFKEINAWQQRPDFIKQDLLEAVKWILEQDSK